MKIQSLFFRVVAATALLVLIIAALPKIFHILYIAPKHRAEVEAALNLLKTCHPDAYRIVQENVYRIDYTSSENVLGFASPFNPTTIYLAEVLFPLNPSPQSKIVLAVIIAHESRHAWQIQNIFAERIFGDAAERDAKDFSTHSLCWNYYQP